MPDEYDRTTAPFRYRCERGRDFSNVLILVAIDVAAQECAEGVQYDQRRTYSQYCLFQVVEVLGQFKDVFVTGCQGWAQNHDSFQIGSGGFQSRPDCVGRGIFGGNGNWPS